MQGFGKKRTQKVWSDFTYFYITKEGAKRGAASQAYTIKDAIKGGNWAEKGMTLLHLYNAPRRERKGLVLWLSYGLFREEKTERDPNALRKAVTD